ncbi:hypothetical protein [Paraburkholderia kururiensis]|uniref:Uncharacterized protein n=1 Tax=Paraburkholderia kururiensis TaxID=984307 RepID=A0ABZ0WRY1_9BURK|nr:hypothetical protein [Paraburkholderia kururiensis]WQD80157.1 hypothetical protein U0042_10985 [Paraburkholderia kururiensis]
MKVDQETSLAAGHVNTHAPEHFEDCLSDESRAAWRIHNILSFVVEAIPEDGLNDLPLKSTLVDLMVDSEKLANRLMDLAELVPHK